MKPCPPASTTPASRRTGSISGVWATAWRAAAAASSSRSTSVVAPLSRAPSAASAAQRTTVRIVPSTGRITAWYAASAAVRSAVVDLGRGRRAPRPERVGEAPEDLAEDHARVAPGAHERPVRDRLADLGHRLGRSELLDDRLEGQRHVRAGVAVGHRVDVQPVQRLLVDAERVPEAGDDPADVGRAELVESRHVGAS